MVASDKYVLSRFRSLIKRPGLSLTNASLSESACLNSKPPKYLSLPALPMQLCKLSTGQTQESVVHVDRKCRGSKKVDSDVSDNRQIMS